MGCLRVLPGSAAVPLPAKSRSCLYSSRCLRRPPHQPITRVLLLHCHSQLLFKLCLVKLTASTRPDLVRVRVRFGPLVAREPSPCPCEESCLALTTSAPRVLVLCPAVAAAVERLLPHLQQFLPPADRPRHAQQVQPVPVPVSSHREPAPATSRR